MEPISIAAGAAGGIVIGILLDRAIIKTKNNQVIEREQLLEESFGEHMYASTFSLNEVKDWLKERENLLYAGAKALVMKVNDETLKTLGKNINIGTSMDNFLVIAIVNESTKKMEDAILVKYERLDERLEDMLAKGNGTMVVKG